MWKYHPILVTVGFEALAFLPFVVLIGYLLSRLHARRPIADSLGSVGLATAIFLNGPLTDPKTLMPTLRLTWEVILLFLVGPILVVAASRARPSNYRLERT